MRPHPERAPAGILCARSVLCSANIARGVDSAMTGEGRRTPPNLIVLNPAGLKPALPIPPAAPALEGWYSRKYAYCTIYRK